MYKKGMTTIISSSELLKRAVAHIDDAMRECPDTSISSLVDDAAMRFNLSPLDSEALLRLFSSPNKDEDGKNNL